jgi:septum formation protein
LQAAGVPHQVVVAQVQEFEEPTASPVEMVLYNASIKAQAVSKRCPGALVLGADTTVALAHKVLNKPRDLAESAEMLRELSGREHTVHTGICLCGPALGIDERHDITAWVRFKPLTEATIREYQRLVNTLDKAGAYGIQEGRDLIIEDYQRPLSTIMGLPVEFVVNRLEQLGVRHRLKAGQFIL